MGPSNNVSASNPFADPLSYKDIMNAQASMARQRPSYPEPSMHDPYGQRDPYKEEIRKMDRKISKQEVDIRKLLDRINVLEDRLLIADMDRDMLLEKLYKFNAIPRG